MTKDQNLVLNGCWIEPHSNTTYLDKGEIRTEFKNNSKGVIEIVKISCQFETEDGLKPYVFSIEPMVSVKPQNISQPIKIPFYVHLSFKRATNYSIIDVVYRYTKSANLITAQFSFPNTRCLIISPMHSPEKDFFISHKDPDQTLLATKLDDALIKIGFRGYVAENDKRPGTDIWKEKIIPKIDECVALIVLWTTEAEKDSSEILREARRAKSKKKKIIVLAEKDANMHPLLKGTKEYIRTANKTSEADLIELVERIEKTYRSGGYTT